MFKLLSTIALLGVANADTHAAVAHTHADAIKTAKSAAKAPKIKDHSTNWKL
jgi:hypothetical protein